MYTIYDVFILKFIKVGLRGPEGSARDSHRTGSSTLVKESLERFWVRPPVSAFDICGFFPHPEFSSQTEVFPKYHQRPSGARLGGRVG